MTDNDDDDQQSDNRTNYVSARSRRSNRNDDTRTKNKGIVT